MARLIKRDRGNYTNLSNIVLRDNRLSWKSRGIFTYLWSQANEWQFYVNEIATHATDGVKALRSGLDELETYGYLKRVNRHNDSGSFDGMDWILSDIGSLKTSQVDSDSDRHDHLSDDAGMEQNSPNKCQNTSDAKGVGRDKGSTRNGTVRNNNNKNYQYKETTNTSNSLSDDPFADSSISESEKSEQIDDLIYKFVSNVRAPISGAMAQQIRNSMSKIPLDYSESSVDQAIKSISTGKINNPVAYLISLLRDARE